MPEQDKAAVALMHQKNKPTVDYSGMESTTAGGRTSEQAIYGDMRGRVLRNFIAPAERAGDAMLIGSNLYRYYSKKTNTLSIAISGVPEEERDAFLENGIRLKRFAVTMNGTATVAGVSAVIVKVMAPNGSFALFTIDPMTGIQLKNEVYGPRGALISMSALTSLTTGTPVNLDQEFRKQILPTARVMPLFPQAPAVRSLAELPVSPAFTPVLPTQESLPVGFALDGVWLRGKAVLLRYSSGGNHFGLLERPANMVKNPNALRPNLRAYQPGVQNWPMQTNAGDLVITYIGNLTPEQAQAVHDGLR